VQQKTNKDNHDGHNYPQGEVVNSVLLVDSATKLDPAGTEDAQSTGTSVDTMVVGVASRDASAGFTVGDPGLAASADNGGAGAGMLPSFGSSNSPASAGLSGGDQQSSGTTSDTVAATASGDETPTLGFVAVAPADAAAAPGDMVNMAAGSLPQFTALVARGGVAEDSAGGSTGGNAELTPIGGDVSLTVPGGGASVDTVSSGGSEPFCRPRPRIPPRTTPAVAQARRPATAGV